MSVTEQSQSAATVGLAEAVTYVVSDRASFLVGANQVIDGGELRHP